MSDQRDNPTSLPDRLLLGTILLLTGIGSIFTIWLFVPAEEWIWIGVTRSKSYAVIEREFIAAGIEFGPEGSLGLDAVSVRHVDVKRARALLAEIRKQHSDDDPVVWIEGIDPPWLVHQDNLSKHRKDADFGRTPD
jgi:hypothetical protein